MLLVDIAYSRLQLCTIANSGPQFRRSAILECSLTLAVGTLLYRLSSDGAQFRAVVVGIFRL